MKTLKSFALFTTVLGILVVFILFKFPIQSSCEGTPERIPDTESGKSDSPKNTKNVELFPVFINEQEDINSLNYKFGFVNNRGEEVISPQFYFARPFSEGLAAFYVNANTGGYIDTSGKVVIKAQYSKVYSFYEGLAVVGIKDKFGYINKTGEMITSPMFGWAGNFSEGLAPVRLGNNEFIYINTHGERAITLNFDCSYAGEFSDGLAAVNTELREAKGKWGFINQKGDLVIKPQFDEANKFTEGLASVKLGGKWGCVNKSGDMVIKPQFDKIYSFSEGLCVVNIGGIEVPDRNYPRATNSFGGWGAINQKGEIIIKAQYSFLYSFHDGLAGVSIDKDPVECKFGFIDKTNTMVIKPQFDIIDSFNNGLAGVAISESDGWNRYGYIDKKGNYIWRQPIKDKK